MKHFMIVCVSAFITFLVWGMASAHIIDGKWVGDGGAPEEGYAFGSGYRAYLYRDSLMHTMRTQHNLMRDMTDGRIETDKETFINASKAFSALITMIPHAFGPEVMLPGSRAKPGIWKHWDIFVSLAEHYKKQAEEVTRIASTEGVAAAKPFVDAIDCGYCHRPFRIQDHELEITDITSATSSQTTAGGTLYYEMGCVGCHGEGKVRHKQMERFPMLAGQNQQYLVSQLKAFKTGGRPGSIMPAVAKTLTDDQITALAAFLSAQD